MSGTLINEDDSPATSYRSPKSTKQIDDSLRAFEKEYEEQKKEWETLLHKKELAKTIKEKVLPQNITINSALCLGLGFIELGRKTALPGKIDFDNLIRAKIPREDQFDAEQKELKLVAKGHRNWGLYQLIVFETVLQCLREPL
jgi:hypothetical protein